MISVKDVGLTKTKEENNNISYDFQADLVLKYTKSGNEISKSQTGQLTVTTEGEKAKICRLYIAPDNLYK